MFEWGIKVTRQCGAHATILHLDGDFTYVHAVKLRHYFRLALPSSLCLLDMLLVSSIDSVGLGLLVGLKNNLGQAGKRLLLFNVPKNIEASITKYGFPNYFSIDPDEKHALALYEQENLTA